MEDVASNDGITAEKAIILVSVFISLEGIDFGELSSYKWKVRLVEK